MQTVPWYLSTGFLGGIGLALSALVTLIVYAAQVATGAEAFDPARLVQLVMGVVQAVAAVLLIVWRVRKGFDESNPSPRIAGGSPPVGPAALVLLIPAGLLSLMLASCSAPPLTPAQGEAGANTVILSCGIVRELVQPDVLPVSPEEAALADRICAGVDPIAGIIFAGLSRPLLSAPRLGAPPEEDAAPVVSARSLAARCARPGLSQEARDACGVMLAAAQEGLDLTVVPRAPAGDSP